MKTFLLIGLLAARLANCACAPGVQAFYPLGTDTHDECGGPNLVTVGTLTFSTVGGFACEGPHTTSNYMQLSAATAAAISNLAAGVVQYDIYLNALDACVMFGTQNANAFQQFQASGLFRWGSTGVGDIVSTATGEITTGAWYTVAFRQNRTNKFLYKNGVLKNADGSGKDGSWGTVTTGNVGVYTGPLLPCNGYIKNLILTKIDSSTIPVVPLQSNNFRPVIFLKKNWRFARRSK